jgi:hypothetical protein
MFRRKDRGGPAEPPPVSAVPTPYWLQEASEDPDSAAGWTDALSASIDCADALDSQAYPDPVHDDQAERAAGHAPGPVPAPMFDESIGPGRDVVLNLVAGAMNATGQAAQLAVCWAVDCLSWEPAHSARQRTALSWYQDRDQPDPDATSPTRTETELGAEGATIPADQAGPWRRAEFAVPGQIALDAADPAVLWVDVQALVTTESPSSVNPSPPAMDVGAGVDTNAASGHLVAWSRRVSSLVGREWWGTRVAIRRYSSGVMRVDGDLTATVTRRLVATDPSGTNGPGAAGSGGVFASWRGGPTALTATGA